MSSKATIKSNLIAIKRRKSIVDLGEAKAVGFVFEPKFEVVEKGHPVLEEEQVNLFEPCL